MNPVPFNPTEACKTHSKSGLTDCKFVCAKKITLPEFFTRIFLGTFPRLAVVCPTFTPHGATLLEIHPFYGAQPRPRAANVHDATICDPKRWWISRFLFSSRHSCPQRKNKASKLHKTQNKNRVIAIYNRGADHQQEERISIVLCCVSVGE